MTTIDAWLLPVLPGAADDPAFIEVIGPTDTQKIWRLGYAADRDRAVSARVAARTEIGRRLGIAPAHVPLLSDGRPRVVDAATTVSWAHSCHWIALAIAEHRPVGIDIEATPDRLDLDALAGIGVASLEEFVGLEAASKASGCEYAGAWPPDVTVRRLAAPRCYTAAVAAPGTDWKVQLHMRSPMKERTDRCAIH